jgi:phosphoribosylglycinamide formyltransferase-1
MKKIAALASGDEDSGGSGFEKLVEASVRGDLGAEVSCVLSNYPTGGVYERAKRLGIRFEFFDNPWTVEHFYQLVGEEIDLVCMSGWRKLAVGFDSTKTINIHPAPLPQFGGPGMHSHFVHEAVMKAYHARQVTHSAVSMHFVTDKFDQGPKFFEYLVEIEPNDTPVTLKARLNVIEHEYQWQLTKQVLEGKITWDGINKDSLVIL